jgi:hypothetical protein
MTPEQDTGMISSPCPFHDNPQKRFQWRKPKRPQQKEFVMDRIEEIVRAMWAAKDPLTGEYDDVTMEELGKAFFREIESLADETAPDDQEDCIPALTAFEVGAPFPDHVPPIDAAHYNYDRSGHRLTILLRNPTAQEIEDVKSGDLQFGLVVYGSVIILLHKMGDSPWADAPYSWHLVPEENRQIPPVETLTPETRALLHIILVDSVTGIIKAQRLVTFSPQFTKSLHTAIRDQSQISNERYDAEVDGLFAGYTTRQLLGLAQAKCKISRSKEDV